MSRKHLALFGVLTALVAAAFGGTGAASAATLCSVNVNPCPAVNIIPAPFNIVGRAPNPVVFNMGANSVTCATSQFTDRILNNPGFPINDAIQNWTFGGCVLNPGGIACTVVAIPNPPPLNWPTIIQTPATNPLADGDFGVNQFSVTITCAPWGPCTVSGANPGMNIPGDWYNPTTASPPKPILSPHSVADFPAVGIVGGPAPCANGTFKGSYEVTLPPFPGADLWLF